MIISKLTYSNKWFNQNMASWSKNDFFCVFLRVFIIGLSENNLYLKWFSQSQIQISVHYAPYIVWMS